MINDIVWNESERYVPVTFFTLERAQGKQGSRVRAQGREFPWNADGFLETPSKFCKNYDLWS